MLYSIGYMHDDPRVATFFAQLNLFSFAMLLLVMGSNFLVTFIGWEGVGLCSYLLIGFWYTNPDYNYAGAQGLRDEPHRRCGDGAGHGAALPAVRHLGLCGGDGAGRFHVPPVTR
jgi:hypothetical protein